MLFLALGLVSTGVLTCPSMAAPTVKRLGATNSGKIQNNTVVASPKSSSAQRASSVRTSGSYVKPTTGSAVSNTKTTNAGLAGSERLSHVRLLNGIEKKLTPGSSQQPSDPSPAPSDLTDRVIILEEQIVTKQPTLEPGDGIDINDQTIRVSEDITALPTKVADLEQRIGDLNVTNYYTITQTQEYLGQNYYTKQYVDQIISQLPSAKIANNFDPGFLQGGQNNSGQGQP
jgi:hypothetical protein